MEVKENEKIQVEWLCHMKGIGIVICLDSFTATYVKNLAATFRFRRAFWPVKNHKYFKKHKLNNEFQSFFLFNILLPEIHSDIKMLYNLVNINM